MSRKKTNLSKDKSIKVPQRDKLQYGLNIYERDDLTEKQKQFIQLLMDKDTKLVFVNGPAGTSKTFLSVYCGLHLMKTGKVSDLIYVRTIAESASKTLGSLPGEVDEKVGPFMMPLMDKLEELLPKPDIDVLLKEQRVKPIPINFLRGASFNVKFILADEAQNFTFQELTTLVTRLGQYTKMVIIGDTRQSDINGRSGFAPFLETFNGEDSKSKGIHVFEFTKDDIVRSELLKFIVDKIEEAKPLAPKH